MARSRLGALVTNLQRTTNINLHSSNIVPSRLSRAINQSDADVVILHWVGLETISIADIGRIRQPLIMELHDMWAFCGAEHYVPNGSETRWQSGYRANNRPTGHGGIDIDRWTWNRKCRAWKRPIQVLCPSYWLANCARNSALMRDWNIDVVPHPLDVDTFKQLDRNTCRTALNLPADRIILLFGAFGGTSDYRKGYDLLLQALRYWRTLLTDSSGVMCVIFGQGEPRKPPEVPFPTRWMGHLYDNVSLALLYNAADVMVVPSRQEALGQTGIEAQACGCPVVGFDGTGLRDVVEDRVTGYLAEAFNPQDLARGIIWAVDANFESETLSRRARERALRLWSPNIVARGYLDACHRAIALDRGELRFNSGAP
jgi:glycosyltransferase involved in cell wall biosynthesis